MKTPIQECLVCNFTEGNRLSVNEMMFGMNQAFNYLLCSNCGSLTLCNPPKNISDFYPDSYYSFSNPNKSKLRLFLRKKKDNFTIGHFDILGMFLNIYSFPESNLKALKKCRVPNKKPNILDVGCGGGTLLIRLQSLGFKNLFGIDPFIDHDKRVENITIEKKTIEDIDSDEKRYDVIFLSHVLEHVRNPVKELSSAKDNLSDNGKIILRIPISSSYAFKKYNRYWFQIDAPRHHFIPAFNGLVHLFDKVGLEIHDFFYDSRPNQIIISKGYLNGIPLVNQINNKIKNIYFSIYSRYLNWSKKGDQAVFILKIKN